MIKKNNFLDNYFKKILSKHWKIARAIDFKDSIKAKIYKSFLEIKTATSKLFSMQENQNKQPFYKGAFSLYSLNSLILVLQRKQNIKIHKQHFPDYILKCYIWFYTGSNTFDYFSKWSPFWTDIFLNCKTW